MSFIKDFIPCDVKNYADKLVKRRKIKSVIVFFSIILICAVICVFYWDVFIKAKIGALLFTGMMSVIIAMFVSKFPWTFKNKSIVGIITDISAKEECDTEYLYTRKGAPYNKINKQILHIDSLDGKKQFVKEISADKEKTFRMSTAYNIGDAVLYLDGTNYFFVFPKDEKSNRTCVICGFSNMFEDESCARCSCTLIKGSKQDLL